VSARAQTLAPLAGQPPPKASPLPTQPFCFHQGSGLLATPWQREGRKRQELSIEEEATVGVVAAAALGLVHSGRSAVSHRTGDEVHWIAASGDVLCTTEVDEAWLRNRTRWFISLELAA
jgi:hypothetical protein